MTIQPHHQKYQAYASATQTVARTKQIVLLYDGIIRFMQQAKEAIAEGRIENRYHALTKASSIIMGLQGCLDFEKGGDVARILYGFYSNMDLQIFAIHRAPSAEACDQIIAEIKKMRDVWEEIDRNNTSSAAANLPDAKAASSGGETSGTDNVTLSA